MFPILICIGGMGLAFWYYFSPENNIMEWAFHMLLSIVVGISLSISIEPVYAYFYISTDRALVSETEGTYELSGNGTCVHQGDAPFVILKESRKVIYLDEVPKLHSCLIHLKEKTYILPTPPFLLMDGKHTVRSMEFVHE